MKKRIILSILLVALCAFILTSCKGNVTEMKTITLVYNDGTDQTKTIEVVKDTVPSIDTLERTGYIFAGWYTDSDLTTKYNNEAITEDITLYAKWVTFEVTYNYSTKTIKSITSTSDDIAIDGYKFLLEDGSNAIGSSVLVKDGSNGYLNTKLTVNVYDSSGNYKCSIDVETLHVGSIITYAGVDTYVFYIGKDTSSNDENNVTIFAVNPTPISKEYKGLEWDAYGKNIGIYDTNKGSDYMTQQNIGYGVKNSAIIIDKEGATVAGKDAALKDSVNTDKTIWKALQTLKQKEDSVLQRQTLDEYGWFIPSGEELAKIFEQRDGINMSDWRFTSSSTSYGYTLKCRSSSESNAGDNNSPH